jgi:PAS domain S-box-containing protein
MPADKRSSSPTAIMRYGFALVSTGLAILVRLLMLSTLGPRQPNLPFFLGFLMTSWYGGLGPALVSIALGTVSVSYFAAGDTSAKPLPFIASTLVVAWIMASQQKTQRRLREALGERRRAENAEERQRRWSHTSLASIGDAVITTDREGRVNFMNPVAEALTGWTAAEAAGQMLGQVFRIINQETRAPVDSPTERVLRDGAVVGLANHTALIARDGRVIPIDDSGAPVRNQRQEVIGAVLVFRDVTERRRALQELESSQQRLALALDAGRMYAWEWNIASGPLEDSLPGIHPEDGDGVRAALRAVKAGEDCRIEYRVVRPDGAIAWLEARGRLVADERGQPVRIAGVSMDITPRKLAEDELRRTKDRVSSILDSITDGFLALDRQYRFTYVNEETVRASGKSKEQLFGQVIWDVFPAAVESEFYPQYQRVMKERVPVHFELRYGPREQWFEVHAHPTEEGLSAYILDIAARKRAEAELKTRLLQQNAVARLGALAISSRDRSGLLQTAVDLLAAELGVEFAAILEALPDNQGGVLRAAHGWPESIARGTVMPGWQRSQAQYTVAAAGPVVVEAYESETRFHLLPALESLRTASGVSVAIPGPDRPFGVLCAHATRRRAFTPDDTQFAQAVANILANAIGRDREEETRARLAAILESSEDAIVGKDLAGIVQTWNRAAERIYGYSAQEMIGRPMALLAPLDRAAEEPSILEKIGHGERVAPFETVRLRKDGTPIHVSITISPVRDPAGRVVGASHIARDISERTRVEEKLQQTQKLESLGILAGGIAHDFNNLLTGILGNASLLTDILPADSAARDHAASVIQAAERAAHLTRQMLAYSGRGRFLVQPMDCSQQVREITALIAASIPKNVEVRLMLAENLPSIEADIGQFQQLVMNLVINGAEASGEAPAIVSISTGLADVDETSIARFTYGELKPGRYVSIEVRDTGGGMDADTQRKIFDPFFTTKFTGRGLGLAAVLGIVRGHKGGIRVRSAPGRGTVFEVLFPVAARSVERESRRPELRAGAQTVLVADDEPLVRRVASAALQKYGYRVLGAENGKEALEVFRSRAAEIALVVLDMTMPVMGGEQAFQELRKIRPEIRVIASSGYSEAEAVERFGQGIAGFMQKPYSAQTLVEKVAEVLGDGRKTHSGGVP